MLSTAYVSNRLSSTTVIKSINDKIVNDVIQSDSLPTENICNSVPSSISNDVLSTAYVTNRLSSTTVTKSNLSNFPITDDSDMSISNENICAKLIKGNSDSNSYIVNDVRNTQKQVKYDNAVYSKICTNPLRFTSTSTVEGAKNFMCDSIVTFNAFEECTMDAASRPHYSRASLDEIERVCLPHACDTQRDYRPSQSHQVAVQTYVEALNLENNISKTNQHEADSVSNAMNATPEPSQATGCYDTNTHSAQVPTLSLARNKLRQEVHSVSNAFQYANESLCKVTSHGQGQRPIERVSVITNPNSQNPTKINHATFPNIKEVMSRMPNTTVDDASANDAPSTSTVEQLVKDTPPPSPSIPCTDEQATYPPDLHQIPCHHADEQQACPLRCGSDDLSSPSAATLSYKFKITSLNVCGLCAKLKSPDFSDFVQDNDIVFLTETKLDDTDECKVEGYTLFRKNRGVCKKKSGGVGVFVKNCFLDFVKIIEQKSLKKRIEPGMMKFYDFVDFDVPNELLLLNLKNVFSPVAVTGDKNFDMLLGVTYVNPEASKYVNVNIFDEIELCLSKFNHTEILLTGDFNARTGSLLDYIDENEDDFSDDVKITDVMDIFDICRKRENCDQQYNNFGCNLVNFCISQGLLIMNGRTGNDKGIGKLTCKGASAIDYFIGSPTIFPMTSDFDVLDFDNCLSDVHCPVTATVNMKCGVREVIDNSANHVNLSQGVEPTCENRPSFVWKSDLETDFVNNICNDRVSSLENDLENLVEKINDVVQDDIDSVTTKFCDILSESASLSGMKKNNS